MVNESSTMQGSRMVGGDLHSRFRTSIALPTLAQGNPPSNGLSWLKHVTTLARQLGGTHLLHTAWSVEASAEASEQIGDDKVQQLLAKQRQARSGMKTEPKSETPEPDDEDSKYEGEKVGNVPLRLEDMSMLILSSAARCVEKFYMNPLTEKVETAPERLLRNLLCEKVISSTDEHHGYLIAGIDSGNLAGFMLAAVKIIQGHEDGRVLAAMRGIANLRKEPKIKMADFVAKAATYRQILVTSGFQFDTRLIREAFIQSLACDPQYAMEVSFARNDDLVTVDDIVRSALLKSRTVEASRANSGLTGLATALPRSNPRLSLPKHKSAQACYNMRDFGECRFGDNCKYTHTSDDPGAAKKPRDRNPEGGCYECGKGHSISHCKEFADRKALQAAMKVELAEAKALMTQVDAPVGSVATIKFPGPDAAIASAVWGN
jgi:hypothetical protein